MSPSRGTAIGDTKLPVVKFQSPPQSPEPIKIVDPANIEDLIQNELDLQDKIESELKGT